MKNKKNLILIVGSSGTGKTEIAKELIRSHKFNRAITCTTREIRDGEHHGIDYIFTSKEKLEKMHKEDLLIENPAQYGGNYYACPKSSLSDKKTTILIVELNGLKEIYKNLKEDRTISVKKVFLEPLEESIILERLKKRNSTKKEIDTRIKLLQEEKKWSEYKGFDLRIKQDTSLSMVDSINKTIAKITSLNFKKPSNSR
jgi:guanylate kinase